MKPFGEYIREQRAPRKQIIVTVTVTGESEAGQPILSAMMRKAEIQLKRTYDRVNWRVEEKPL